MHLAALLLLFASTPDWTSAMKSGNAAVETGEYKNAAQKFRDALRVAKSDYERAASLNNLAAVEESLGEVAEAERHYEQCIAAWSRVPDAPSDALAKPLNNLALLYRRRGQYDRAAELYKKSFELNPRAGVLSNLGRLSFARRRYQEAEAYYLRALALDPDDAATLANVAELQVAMGRFAAARRTAEQVLNTEKGRPLEIAARQSLAAAYVGEKQWRDAEPQLHQAMQLANRLYGDNHAVTASVYSEYAKVVRKLDRKREAADYEERARRASESTAERNTVSVSELLTDQRR